MAQKSRFFNSVNGDRRYKAEDWASYFAGFMSNGVLLKESGALSVATLAGSMGIAISPGAAMINGYRYENDDTLNLTLAAASLTQARIDAVMIRWSAANRNITACIVQGTPASSPVAPVPTRSKGVVYELCLARIFVSVGATSISQFQVEDTRLKSDVCGVATMIGELDTTTLYTQIQAALADFQSGAMADYQAWFDTLQQTLGENEAANLLAMIQQHQTDITANASAIATLLGSLRSGAYKALQVGVITVSAAAAGTTEYTFNFPTPFLATPVVFPVLLTSAPQSRGVSPLSRTATQAVLEIRNELTAASIPVLWMALARPV